MWYDSDDGDWTHLAYEQFEERFEEKLNRETVYLTGTINWAKILGDPVDNYNKDGKEWTFDFTPDADGVKVLKRLNVEHKLRDKGDERGKFLTLKQRATRPDGKAAFPIRVFDAHNELWDPKINDRGEVTNKIGNGSLGEAKIDVVDYGKTKAPQARYGLYPIAVRVLELKEFVRQEFAPLPEGSPYLDDFSKDAEEEAPENVGTYTDPLEA